MSSSTTRRLIILLVVSAIVVIVSADLLHAFVSRNRTVIDCSLPSGPVVADGIATLDIIIHVTENGKPRKGDLMQSWIVSGEGKLRPAYFFIDQEGKGTLTFTPNVLTTYSDRKAVFTIRDNSFGKIIEVAKEVSVTVSLEKPSGATS